MIEKYDFSLDAEMKKSAITDTVINKGNNLVFVNQMLNNGSFSKEYSPPPSFYVIYKSYYPNGNLKSCGKYLGKYVLVDNWYYYDENGNLEKKVDEDSKFGKIKPDQILSLLNEEGHIDLTTGRGREEIKYRQSGKGYIENGLFFLKFFKKGEYNVINNEYPLWIITINSSPENDFHKTIYHVHGDTGEVISKEVKKVFKRE